MVPPRTRREPAQATSSPRWDGRLSSWFTCPGAGSSSVDASRALAARIDVVAIRSLRCAVRAGSRRFLRGLPDAGLRTDTCACAGDERLSSWFTCPGAGGSSVDASRALATHTDVVAIHFVAVRCESRIPAIPAWATPTWVFERIRAPAPLTSSPRREWGACSRVHLSRSRWFVSDELTAKGVARLSSWFTCPGAGGSSANAREHSRPANVGQLVERDPFRRVAR